jgi:hypothetical protein
MLPSRFKATLCPHPAAIAATSLAVAAGGWLQTSLSQAFPHSTTFPVAVNARLCEGPAAIATTPLRAVAGTVHCPTFASAKHPQATTAPAGPAAAESGAASKQTTTSGSGTFARAHLRSERAALDMRPPSHAP